jgi:hypothetical protein
MRLPGPLGIRLAATVQPGCTNLWLGTLLHSRTDADADRCIGRQVRAKLNTNLEWPSFSHTFILGEHTANINSPSYAAIVCDRGCRCERDRVSNTRSPRARVCSGSGPDPQDRWEHREQELPRRGTGVGRAATGPDFQTAMIQRHHRWAGEG